MDENVNENKENNLLSKATQQLNKANHDIDNLVHLAEKGKIEVADSIRAAANFKGQVAIFLALSDLSLKLDMILEKMPNKGIAVNE